MPIITGFMAIALLLFPAISFSQPVTAYLQLSSANPELPIQLILEKNDLTNISTVRLTALPPTKFASFDPDGASFEVFPVNETIIEISCNAGSTDCFGGAGISILDFLTDNTTLDQNFLVEFLNPNRQSMFEQSVGIVLPTGISLPPPCSQTFLNLNTGVGVGPGQVDPGWTTGQGNVVYSINGNIYPTQGQNSTWVNYLPNNGGNSNFTMTYIKKFCATDTSNAVISLCVAADNFANVYLNNNLIAQTVSGNYGFLYFSCINNLPVTVLQGTNELKVEVTNIQGSTGFLISNASILTQVGNLGLVSERCCGPNVHGTIIGRKIWDLNCNGKLDPGDNPVPGWTIFLTSPDNNTISTQTDINGYYTFPYLAPGTYTLFESVQQGWSQGQSAGPYSVYVGPNSNVFRDFLNCKEPTCEELFVKIANNDECCNTNFAVSNANGAALQTLTYTVTGGVLNSVTVTPCVASTTPVNLNGTSSGTLVFNTSCTAVNTLNFDVNATATNATGNVCITWNGTFLQNGQIINCSTETCITCERMPKDCGNLLNVLPNVFGPVNTDYRNFTITNGKQPVSQISSIDIAFINESVPHHIGGGLVVDGNNRNWTFNNSGGPADAYTQVRLACSGNAIHGPAANNTVSFNLGVDNTTIPPYSGIVKFKVAYCDGDTCEMEYNWQPIIKNDNSGHLRAITQLPKVHLFGVEVILPDNAVSYSISLNDTSKKVIATTPPKNNINGEEGEISNYIVQGEGSTIFYMPESLESIAENVINHIVHIVYTNSEENPDNEFPVYVRYFDSDGREVGYAQQIISGTEISDVDDIPLISKNKNILIKISPNPVNDNAILTLKLLNDEFLSIIIIDLQGNEVSAIQRENLMVSGNHEFNINTRKLANGSYFVLVQTKDGQSATGPFKVLK